MHIVDTNTRTHSAKYFKTNLHGQKFYKQFFTWFTIKEDLQTKVPETGKQEAGKLSFS